MRWGGRGGVARAKGRYCWLGPKSSLWEGWGSGEVEGCVDSSVRAVRPVSLTDAGIRGLVLPGRVWVG